MATGRTAPAAGLWNAGSKTVVGERWTARTHGTRRVFARKQNHEVRGLGKKGTKVPKEDWLSRLQSGFRSSVPVRVLQSNPFPPPRS